MLNYILALVLLALSSTYAHGFSSSIAVYDQEGSFLGDFSYIINMANNTYGRTVERKEMEEYSSYEARIRDYENQIKEIEDRKFNIVINPDFLEYDWANKMMNIGINFPVPAKRINDFKGENQITYKVQTDKSTAREYLIFKNDLHLDVIFKIRKGFILVEKADIYYRESQITSH